MRTALLEFKGKAIEQAGCKSGGGSRKGETVTLAKLQFKQVAVVFSSGGLQAAAESGGGCLQKGRVPKQTSKAGEGKHTELELIRCLDSATL